MKREGYNCWRSLAFDTGEPQLLVYCQLSYIANAFGLSVRQMYLPT
jgi:hypothetical protein